MTNKQFKIRFLLSRSKEECDIATMYIWAGENDLALEHLHRALSFLRQLPSIQKYRAMRAYVQIAITALERM